jgi:hypothetical protein
VIEKVTQARALLPEVEVPMEIRLKISQVSMQNFLYIFLTEEARCVLSLMLMVCAVTSRLSRRCCLSVRMNLN